MFDVRRNRVETTSAIQCSWPVSPGLNHWRKLLMRKVISIFIAALMLTAVTSIALADGTAKHGPKLAVKGGHYEGTAKANTITVDVASDGKAVDVNYTCAADAAVTTMTAKVKGNQFNLRRRTAAIHHNGKGKGNGHANASTSGKKIVTLYVHGQFHRHGTVKGKVLVASCSSKRLSWKATLVTGPTGVTGTTGATGASGPTS
ncbi:MAG: hypothetical protein JJE27_00825 [Thermoleophilia bacterium]|nr:hypothetical protein [Thermoleophilia bacterium]